MDVALQLQNATLFLSASDAQLLPSAVQDGKATVTCYVLFAANSLGTHGADSDCQVAGVELIPTRACSTSTVAGGACLQANVMIMLPVDAPDMAAGPSTAGFLTISSDSNTSFSASAEISLQRAPRLLSAKLSSSLSSIEITFDRAINTPPLSCDLLLHGAERFGTFPGCGWSLPEVLTVVLGSGATILPGDLVELAVRLSDTTGKLISPAGLSAAVLMPRNPLLPRVTLSGPNSISVCDTAVITASAGVAQGATFEWVCASDVALDAILRNQTNGPVATIKGSLLSLGTTYIISVRAQNRFGIWSDTAVRSLSRSTVPAPLISVVLPPPPYLRSQSILVEAFTDLSSCLSAPATSDASYYWSVAAIAVNGTISQPVLKAAGPTLMIAPGLLSPGVQYAVNVAVLLAGQV